MDNLKSLETAHVSAFSSIKKKQPDITIKIIGWLKNEGEYYRNKIDIIRNCKDEALQKSLKSELPLVTMSGTFLSRRISGLIKHSGYMCIDIDGKDNPHITDYEKFKTELAKIENIAYAGLSVRGNGVFCLIPISYPEKHVEHFNAFKVVFKSLNINIDESCRDVCRLRFLSYDDKAYYNDDAVDFEQLLETEKKKTRKLPDNVKTEKFNQTNNSQESTLVKVNRIIQKIVDNGLDITGDHDQWFRICAALANEFKEDGRVIFHTVSQFSNKYDENDSDKQFSICLESENSAISIGTFFYYTKKNGLS